MVSWIGLVRILSTFGSAALAGYTIAIRVVIFALLPSWGLSNAAATMVGQGLGAKKPDRAEQAVWTAANYNAVFLTIVGVIFFVGANFLVRLFTHDADVALYAVSCLRIVSLGFPLYAYGMVLTQSFNGAGDTWTPTWLNLFCFWLWEIPLAWALAHAFGLRATGRIHFHYRGLLHPRSRERRTLPARALETPGRLALGRLRRIARLRR